MAISRKQLSCSISLCLFLVFSIHGVDVDIEDGFAMDQTIPQAASGEDKQDYVDAPERPSGAEMKTAAQINDQDHLNDPGGHENVQQEDGDAVTLRKDNNPGSCMAIGMEGFLTEVLGSSRKCEVVKNERNLFDDRSQQTCRKPIVYGRFAELKDASGIPTHSEETPEEADSLKIIRTSLDEITKAAMRSLRFLYDVLQELQDSNGKSLDKNLTASNKTVEKSSLIEKEDGEKITETVVDNNGTAANINFTDSTKKKIQCVGKNFTENDTAEVRVVDNVILNEKLNPKTETGGTCTIVMFYAPWCVFCARTAPHYNALARAFPQMDVLAIDAVHFGSLNVRYGTTAVPNIMVFHGGRPITRFNKTERTLEQFVAFVSNVTGFKPLPDVNLTDADFEGPVPSTPTNHPDYLLLLAWVFIIICVTYMVVKSNSGQQLWQKVQHLWLEHQHLD
ncbi:thioredoxin domain-containing protein 15-like [Lineus longissimus]|uniref:thioredoxin domain-containing protein 15-like n=1 Tax=Lineus longissimus TaxID=88925 RepID=UPI002B4DEA34